MLAIEHRQQARKAFLDRGGFEQLLPLFQVEIQIDRDQIGEMARVFRVQRGDLDLLGQRRGKFDDLLKLALRIAHHRRQLDRIFRDILHQLEFRAEIRLGAACIP